MLTGKGGEIMPRLGGFVLIALFAVCIALSGCNKPAAEIEITLDVDECADVLLETIAFQDILTAVSDEMATTLYQISEQDAVKQKVYVSSGATAEEIAVFEAADAVAAKRIEKAVLQRVAEQQASFKDYLPAELPKLNDPFILVRDKYVILCISDDNEKVKTKLDRLFN
ncbi:MAG: DUF4358 domain-containing protein [Firmicutes bacterium]|jgi:hypothetical protein|nr:DUF4358 domain-containing protein [Bacillota bacterium]